MLDLIIRNLMPMLHLKIFKSSHLVQITDTLRDFLAFPNEYIVFVGAFVEAIIDTESLAWTYINGNY